MKKLLMSILLLFTLIALPINNVNAEEINSKITATVDGEVKKEEPKVEAPKVVEDKNKDGAQYIPTAITQNPEIATIGAAILAAVIGFILGNKKKKERN